LWLLDTDEYRNFRRVKNYAYTPGWKMLEEGEQEERISFKGPEGGIDNIKNYILSVDKVEDLQEGRPKKPDPKKGTGQKTRRFRS
jgi:hypothetical protein